MKKLLAVVLCASMLLGACSSGAANPAAGPAADPAAGPNKKLKVALLLSGPANDQGWNAIAFDGLKAAETEYGIEAAYMENVSIADTEAAYSDYASQGYDLIIGHGFQFGDPAVNVAKKFPDKKFMATESASQFDNMASYVMSCHEGAYLMGLLCASMTTTGKLGVIGGFEQPSIVKEVEAFKAAAKTVNPDITIYEIYINSFTDVSVGKEAALAMIDKGADVLYHVANQAGTGAIKAAEEKGLLACGNSFDQSSIAPDTIMCSTVYNMPKVILTAVNDVKSGSFKGGIFNLGMAEGVVEISGYNNFESKIPDDVKLLISDTQKKIIDGSFVVPMIETPTK